VVVPSGSYSDAGAPTIASGQQTLPSGDAATLAASSSEMPVPVKRSLPVIPIALGLVLAVGGGALYLRSTPKPAAAPSTPASTPTPAPPAPLASIEVRFKVQPSEAQALLDGKPTQSPIVLPLDKSSHTLELRAVGYVTDSRTVIADRDREYDVVLSKAAAPTPSTTGKPVVVKTAAPPPTAPPPPTTKPTIEIKGPMEKAL
jgi:hypothetical protein